ncbi:hypothetical protein [Streptomyces inhibens]|uniref:hypothetical protein n=1 Tax=Streptomyces inhibens TaxID=2293571 RepID=UPI001EE77D92|nr:hypothetical protein [Streptomyces inhibens]UKY48198.1 hypothetical protein KI385_04825 [Streptomyces inhibens]
MTYEATGDVTSLHQAARHSRDAVDTAGPEHPKYAIYASNLSSALRFEYEQSGTPEALDEAIGHGYYAQAREVLSDINAVMYGRHDPPSRVGLAQAVDTASRKPYWRFRP